jgi:hypothetical protein
MSVSTEISILPCHVAPQVTLPIPGTSRASDLFAMTDPLQRAFVGQASETVAVFPAKSPAWTSTQWMLGAPFWPCGICGLEGSFAVQRVGRQEEAP